MQFKKGMGIENQQSIQTSYVAMLVGIKRYGNKLKMELKVCYRTKTDSKASVIPFLLQLIYNG